MVRRNVVLSLIASALAMAPSDIRLNSVNSDLFAGETFESGYAKLEGQGDMFFWFFPARNSPQEAPLVLWLNGGPGCSSDFGALRENGPISIKNDVAVSNPYSWSNHANMIYVDQPLSVGYSRADTKDAYANQRIVAENLRSFLENLLVLKPEFKGRKFIISGESYAGHYIPRIGSLLLNNPVEGLNFSGVAIGNGWYSAPLQYPAYADFGYEFGLIDENQFKRLKPSLTRCGALLGKNQNNFLARLSCSRGRSEVFGDRNVYDYTKREPYDPTELVKFLNRADVQEALGVLPGGWEECTDAVGKSLQSDVDVDSRPELAHIIANGLKTLIFAGDYDIICNFRGNEQVVYSLDDNEYIPEVIQWKGAKEIQLQPFKDYHGIGEYKTVDNVTFLRVFNAGHMVPMDQPKSASIFFDEFLTDKIAPPSDAVIEGAYHFQTSKDDGTQNDEEVIALRF